MDTKSLSGTLPFKFETEKLRRVEGLFQIGTAKTAHIMAGLDAGQRQDFLAWNLVMNVVEAPFARASSRELRALRLAVSAGLGHSTATKSTPVHERLASVLVDLARRGSAPILAHEIIGWHGCLSEHVLKSSGGSKRMGSAGPRTRRLSAGISDLEDLADLPIFVAWLNGRDPAIQSRPSALVRAGVAYFWIKNSRALGGCRSDLASALSTAILAEDGASGVITGMFSTMRRYPQQYTDLLQLYDGDDITHWLLWFAAKVVEAQKRQFAQIEFLICIDRLIEQAYMDMNARQQMLLLDLRDAGPDGYPRGITASDYMRITGTSIATATRDLVALVEIGIFSKRGENKWRRYFLNVPRDPIPAMTVEMIL